MKWFLRILLFFLMILFVFHIIALGAELDKNEFTVIQKRIISIISERISTELLSAAGLGIIAFSLSILAHISGKEKS